MANEMAEGSDKGRGEDVPGAEALPAIPVDHPVSEMISIPLPPRGAEAAVKPRKPAKPASPEKEKPEKPEKVPLTPEQQRRRELGASIVVALGANCLLVALFLFLAVGSKLPGPESLLQIQTAAVVPEEKSDSSGGEPSRQKPEPAAAGAASNAAKVVTTLATRDVSLPSSSSDSLALSSLQIDATLPMFGASLNGADFDSAESERQRQIRNFVNGNGRGGGGGNGTGRGVGRGTLEGIFSKEWLGDGTGMALLTDQSGSMQSINNTVKEFVDEVFPRARGYEVIGCALNHARDPAIRQMVQLARRSSVTDIFFVCDLQDGEGIEGIKELREELLGRGSVKRLHVISFDRNPGTHLARLIRETEGTFRYVDPYLPRDDK